MKTIKELMESRFACKRFDIAKKISASDLQYILEAACLSPSSFGLQAWKFVVVTNEELKTKLTPVCHNQAQIAQSAALIVLCARTDFSGENNIIDKYIGYLSKNNAKSQEKLEEFRERLHKTVEEKGSELNNWLKRQLFLAADTILMAATEKEIDSCPMEGFDEEGVSKVLELPEYLHPTLLIALGYRDMEKPIKYRFDFEEFVEIRS